MRSDNSYISRLNYCYYCLRLFYGFLLLTPLIPVATWASVSISDPDITDNIEHEFLFDRVVPFNTIDVRTEKGIVKLNGKVYNLLAKERATRLAETVRGVRSVVNTIKVDPIINRSAAWLEKNVKLALRYDPATESHEITIKSNSKGEITLSGKVDSWQERALSEKVAKGVSGVTRVNNNIIVNVKSKRADSEIKLEIEGRLRWDTLVDHALIDVKVANGSVFLTGTVGSAAEKRRATRDAWVGGVKQVDNTGLNVACWTRDDDLRKTKYSERSDLEIREAVQDALRYDPRVNDMDMKIRVKNGIVTLRGVLDNLKARQAALADTRNTVGVMGIRNLVKVRPLANLDDAKIADNIKNAFLRDSITESYDIKVRVKDGAVHLYGTVDSYFEKAQAEDLAFRAKGVKAVRNHLSVDYAGALVYDPYIYDWSIYDFPWYSPADVPLKTDWAIREDIKDELFWSPFVDAETVSVMVDGGVATLEGAVSSWREFEAAAENAMEGGAVRVINKLKCKCNAII